VPHALIKSIDVTRALKLPGVAAIITGKDLPIPYGILPVSQDEHTLSIGKVRFIGDPVAAIAAVDEDTAFEAMDLIDVEYERLKTISSIEEAVYVKKSRSSSAIWTKASRKPTWFVKTCSFTKAIRTYRSNSTRRSLTSTRTTS
jgi:xanthine dehydrogenase molybdopterin-binding subunit B